MTRGSRRDADRVAAGGIIGLSLAAVLAVMARNAWQVGAIDFLGWVATLGAAVVVSAAAAYLVTRRASEPAHAARRAAGAGALAAAGCLALVAVVSLPLERILAAMLGVLALALGALSLSAEARRTVARRSGGVVLTLLRATIGVAVGVFMVFLLFEAFPGLLRRVNLDWVRYYSYKRLYVADSALVFRYRNPERVERVPRFTGDLYADSFRVALEPVEYHATYHDGFRTNSSTAPFDVVVIGDSFIEIGRSDSTTFTERLRAATGRSVFNLGMAAYGPNQYVELLRRYGPTLRPRVAIYCFFGGNDIADVREYARWKQTGTYYYYRLAGDPLFTRLGRVVSDVREAVAGWDAPSRREQVLAADGVHPDVAFVELGGRAQPMLFPYSPESRPPDTLLATTEWQEVARTIREFRDLAASMATEPIVVYIPAKSEVYIDRIAETSGARVRALRERVGSNVNTQSIALGRLSAGAGVRFVDLLEPLRDHAAKGELLYYPFDTHWNDRGQQLAAQAVATALGWSRPR